MSYLLETGIVLNGQRLPGTDWILRDSRAWFVDEADAPMRRTWPIRQLVFHWTAGTAKVGPEVARDVVRNMNARRREDGSLMSVSVTFVTSWDGMCFQVADLCRQTNHAGRVINRASVSNENAFPGSEAQMRRLGIQGGAVQRRTVGGHKIDCMVPSAAMLAANVRLAETLASLDPATGVAIPRIVPAGTDRMRPPEALRYAGALEHCHAPGSTKLDHAGYVVDALAANGWQRAA